MREPRLEFGDRRGQQGRAEEQPRPHAQMPGAAGLEGTEFRLREVPLRFDLLGVPQKRLAESREHDTARAPFEQGHAEIALEPVDRLADGRLADRQRLRARADASALRDG